MLRSLAAERVEGKELLGLGESKSKEGRQVWKIRGESK